ncbi:MAG: hypothetical protein ACJ0BN_11365 [Limisphaerales bacterium]|nr:MAG: hypothetical protein EVA71_09135 [Limisphaerales bacterium]HBP57724.1 hypothetical protein [Verrucomicrobiales bacterium]HCP37480.1 hypothetical protein [Verrucomicrobiales bacterium]
MSVVVTLLDNDSKELTGLVFRELAFLLMGRVCFAHASPWHIQIQGQALLPSSQERKYLVERVNLKIERSKALLPIKALMEYETARKFYESLPVRSVIDASANAVCIDAFRRSQEVDHHHMGKMSTFLGESSGSLYAFRSSIP